MYLKEEKRILVTRMAKAAARVNPQYVYCENPIVCKNLSKSLQKCEGKITWHSSEEGGPQDIYCA